MWLREEQAYKKNNAQNKQQEQTSSALTRFVETVRQRQKTGTGFVTTREPEVKKQDVYDFSKPMYERKTVQEIQAQDRQQAARDRYESVRLALIRNRYARLPGSTVFVDEEGNRYTKGQVLQSIDAARRQYARPGVEYSLGQAVGSPMSSWDPGTRVAYETRTGEYSPVFPYEGAQYYREYSDIVQRHPELAATRMVLSPTLNLDLAMASPEQRERILIQYLHQAKGSPTGGADFIRGASMVSQAPIVQIASAYGIGKGIGAGLTLASKRIGMKLAAQGALRLTAKGIGAGFTIPAAVDVYGTYKEKGLPAGIGKGLTTVLSFGAAGVGFKESYKPFKLPSFIKYGRTSTPTGTTTNIRGFEVKGVPIEKTKLIISEVTAWKPTGKKQLFLGFPGKEQPKAYGFEIGKITKLEKGIEKAPEGQITKDSFFKLEGYREYTHVEGKSYKMLLGESKVYKKLFGIRQRIFTVKEAQSTNLKTGRPLGGVTRQINKTVPRQILRSFPMKEPIFETGLETKTIVGPINIPGYLGKQKPVFETTQKHDEQFSNKPVFMYKQKTSFKSISSFESASSLKLEQLSRQNVSQRQGIRQETFKLQKPVQKQKQVYKTTPIYPEILFPKTDLFGRGIREYGWKEPTIMEYKFRKANIKLPFSDIKTPRFKT